MKYHAPTNSLVIDLDTLKRVSLEIRYALRHMREALKLPLEPYKSDGPLQPIDHAGKALLEAAKVLGIDMGAEWQDQLDLREKP